MSNENFLPINLPSKCIPYDGIKPEDVQIRSYEGRDEIYLSQITPVNLSQKFLLILQRVLRGIEPKKLTMGDRMFLIMWEYINSYSDSLRYKTVCSHCLRQVDLRVDLNKLEKIELDDDFKHPHILTLPICGEDVSLRLYTIEDEIAVEKWEDENNPDPYLYRFARVMVDDKNIHERMKYLGHLKGKDMAVVRTFHEKFMHGIDMCTTSPCPKCGEEEEIEIPFRFDFIFPDGQALVDSFGEGV